MIRFSIIPITIFLSLNPWEIDWFHIMHDSRPTLGSTASSGNNVGPNHTLSMDDPLRRTGANHEQPTEMAGIKDGIALSPEEEHLVQSNNGLSRSHSTPLSNTIRLDIKCPSLTGSSDSSILAVSKTSTIAQVKQIVEQTWPGRPKANGMRFFKAGQTLSDEMIVGNIVKEEERNEPTPVHLVIRPDAWKQRTPSRNPVPSTPSQPLKFSSRSTAKADTLPARKSSLPSITLPSSQPMQDHIETADNSRHLANMVENMEPSQYDTFRSLISWTYARYVDIYEKEWNAIYGDENAHTRKSGSELSELAAAMGCSIEEVNLCIDQLERDVLLWDSVDDAFSYEVSKNPFKYKNVTIDGLPYLLRVEQSPQSEKLRLLHSRIEHLRLLYHQIEKLINYHSILDRAVPTSAHVVSAGVLAVRGNGLHPAVGGAMIAPHQAQAIDRAIFRNRFVGLQREDWFNVLFSTAFLTFKIGLLVYVFTRGASPTKQKYMVGFACLYILYESYRTLMKRVQVRRRAIRRALGRDAVNEGRANAANGDDNRTNRQQGTSQNSAEGTGDQNQQEIPVPAAPNRYTIFSPFLLEFWIERLAYWRMSEEDREMGLRMSTGNRNGAQQVQHDPISKLIGVMNDYILMPIVLFTSTLIPEIEQRRRRAIDQRDEMIRSTARKVEERERILREEADKQSKEGSGEEEKENSKDQHDSSSKVSTSTSMSVSNTSIQIRQPALLRSRYAQRILDERRSEGRQIDINQELEAAAAAAAREDGEGAMEPADMGFI